MLLSAVSVLVVTQQIFEVPEGITYYPVDAGFNTWWCLQYVPGWCSATLLTACCTKSIRHQCRHMLHPTGLLKRANLWRTACIYVNTTLVTVLNFSKTGDTTHEASFDATVSVMLLIHAVLMADRP